MIIPAGGWGSSELAQVSLPPPYIYYVDGLLIFWLARTCRLRARSRDVRYLYYVKTEILPHISAQPHKLVPVRGVYLYV